MASYVVLESEDTSGRGDEVVFVRDGFSFLAFIVPFFWFLWHRMWFEALAALVLSVTLGALAVQPGAYSAMAPLLSLLLGLLIGLEARALRVAALRRRGWHEWGLVEADSIEEAEARFATEVASAARRPAAAPPLVRAVPPASRPRPATEGPSLGLIDYPRKS